ncbi:hypothetical protein [Aurantimonas sp. VKM B-3413]|uniref:hypothetical protein n=1 Tax=Aurantimonas sp. VKM B-3413 TaxID=2779401 RepID=UPI001E2C3805|nr:hypothetical protein [Aurantimonas sp. VKM B-3413]MCB8837849.1 hypothetical protein [Aurantimonas sp. VKM B-3413]
MRRLLLASALALTASLSFGASAQAAGVTVVIGDHHPDHVRDHHRRPVTHRERRHMARAHDCFTKKVVTRQHGRKVVKTTKVCR